MNEAAFVQSRTGVLVVAADSAIAVIAKG